MQLRGLVDAIEERQNHVKSYMLKHSLRATKKIKRARLYEQARNYAELQALDSQIIQLEGLMEEDKMAIKERNKRIMTDLAKIDSDRSAQIRKLILRYASALAENSQRVYDVFNDKEPHSADIRKVKSQQLEASISEAADDSKSQAALALGRFLSIDKENN